MRKIDEHAFQEGELVESWSKPKIYIALGALLVILCAGIVGYSMLEEQVVPKQERSVLSASDAQVRAQNIKLPNSQDVSNILEQAKENLSQITSENLTSSQAAIQKIIQDLQGLQNGSGSAVGVFCDLVCKK